MRATIRIDLHLIINIIQAVGDDRIIGELCNRALTLTPYP